MSHDIPMKDLPGEPACAWKTMEEPEGRHLAGEFVAVAELLAFGKAAAEQGGGNAAAVASDSAPAAMADFLVDVAGMYRPKVVLELGSGAFAPALAPKMQEIWAGASIAPRYVTLSHEERDVASVQDKVKQAKLQGMVKSLLCPLVDFKVGDAQDGNQQVLTCYDFNENRLFEACAGLRPDMLIINGPDTAGYVLPRMLTVPILSQYLQPGALVCVVGAGDKTARVEIESWIASDALHPIGAKAIGGGIVIGQIQPNSQNVK